jgi:peroxiredoxin family protein
MSKMNMMGLGRKMIEREMRKKNITGLAELVQGAREMGAHFHCCETSALIFGWTPEELEKAGEGFDVCGAATMLSIVEDSHTTLFI